MRETRQGVAPSKQRIRVRTGACGSNRRRTRRHARRPAERFASRRLRRASRLPI